MREHQQGTGELHGEGSGRGTGLTPGGLERYAKVFQPSFPVRWRELWAGQQQEGGHGQAVILVLNGDDVDALNALQEDVQNSEQRRAFQSWVHGEPCGDIRPMCEGVQPAECGCVRAQVGFVHVPVGPFLLELAQLPRSQFAG